MSEVCGNYLTMSNKKISPSPVETLDPTPSPWAEPRDIRDLFSYRLAYLVRLNDRHAQTVLIDQYGLTLGEWRTLATIRYLGRPSLRHLARTTQQDEGQLSRYVSGLIKRELLEKKSSATDQRVIELSLTPKGVSLHDDVMIFAWKLNQDMFTDLAPEEQTQLLLLLDKLFQKVIKF
jgi:DNA-binding MarR family transcriptional regulator